MESTTFVPGGRNRAQVADIPLGKPYASRKSPGEKCNCAYCDLRGASSQKSKTAAKTSLVGNPKYRVPSCGVGTVPLKIGAAKIEKKSPSEDETTQPENPGSNSSASRKTPEPATDVDSCPRKVHRCVCGNSYYRSDHLRRHVKFSCKMAKVDSPKTVAAAPAAPSKIRCDCGEGFDCVYNLVRHKAVCTEQKPPKPFKCACGSVFVKYESLVEHQKTDCDSKKKHVITCSLVKIPKKTHSKDLPYPCPCGRQFARVCDLSRHKIDCDLWNSDKTGPHDLKGDRIERGKSVGNFSCDCGEVFTARGALFSHQNESCNLRESNRKDATGSVEPIYRRAVSQDEKMRHQKICKDAKGTATSRQVKCRCGKTFSRPDAMVAHQKNVCVLRNKGKTLSRIGSGKKSKQCKCGATFTLATSLRRHIARSCPKYKRKPKTAQATTKRKYDVARGSRVIRSKRWGIVQGPPFVCQCKSSYISYSRYCFHRNHSCPLSPDGTSHPVATIPAETKPRPGKASTTEQKFTCPCGRAFNSVLSLNGHRTHCSQYLSLLQSMELCPICQAMFASRQSVVRHVQRIHNGVSNIKVGAKVKKIVAKSPKSKKRPPAEGLVIASVQSLANSTM